MKVKLFMRENEYTELNPILSSQIGIEAIYQEFNLAPELTVQENYIYGYESQPEHIH